MYYGAFLKYGTNNVANNGLINRIKDLSELRKLLTQEETGLDEYLYPQLELGDVWWISDSITGFSIDRAQHPWVIVNGYSPSVASVIASPRTTSYLSTYVKRGLMTPANILPGLEKEGLLLLHHRRTFPATKFRDFEYIGKLPEPWRKKIRAFYQALAEGKNK
jgi:hypothetical protein